MIPTSNFSIRTFCGGYDKNFCYLITCSHTGYQILIDAPIDQETIRPFFTDAPLAILITHSHHDHIHHIDQYQNLYPDLIILGHQDSPVCKKYNFKPLKDKSTIKIGNLHIQSLYTPGHYFDSICFKLDPVLFTGDTLFVGRTGRVLSRKSSLKNLYKSVYNIILKLPPNTRIFPGHNYGKENTITIAENIKISPLLQAKSFNDFKLKMEFYESSRIKS